MENKALQIASDLDTEQQEIEIVGIHTLCRLCASQNERLIGIFSEEGISNDLSNKINLYLPIKVAASDELPLQCCWNCASTLLAWHELVLTSVEIDRKFRNSQFITEKQIIEDEEGFDNSTNPISDDNDACDNNEGLNVAEGNIVALFHQIKRQQGDQEPSDAEYNTPIQEENTQKCEICDKILSCRPNYLSHIKTHISDNYCQICCNSYNTKFKLDTHFASHKLTDNMDQSYIQCDFEKCLEKFPSKLQFYNHKNNHLNVSKFKCDICSVEFFKKSALDNHKSRHETPLTCNICDKTFANKKTLKEHNRLHTGEKPFKCQQCNAAFRCQSGLKYHEVSHSKERKYRCQVCELSFTRSNYLKEHLRKHSNEKPYQCQYCSQNFIQLGVLRRHEARMHIKCDVCKSVVGKARDLKEHKWKNHNLETT